MLEHYEKQEPTPFIQFTEFSDVHNGLDYDATYELMSSGPNVRVLITPETPKDKVIQSLFNIFHRILNDNVLERISEELRSDKEAKGKFEEIKNKLEEAGYTKENIQYFCEKNLQKDSGDSPTELDPF